jgi:heavy metal sensor kinase
MPSPSSDWRPWRTLRGQLTLLNTVVVLLVIGAGVMIVRLGLRAVLEREVDAMLRGGVREVAAALDDLYPDIDSVVAEMQRKARSNEDRGWFMHLLTADGRTIWKSDHCPDEVSSALPANLDRREAVRQVGSYRWVRLMVAEPGEQAFLVRVGMSTEVLDESIAAVLGLLIAAGGFLTLFAPLVGYVLAVRATRPVADILRTADRLEPRQLADRLPVRGTSDELDQLASTINRLLDQVAGELERQEQFVADAAHELRGPLAAVQSALEVALSQPRRATEAYRETLADVLEATRHLAKVANDLLLLAERDGGRAIEAKSEPVSVAVIAGQAVGMFLGVAEDRGIDLSLNAAEPGLVAGDQARLRRVVGNLLDNAIRFTPRGGRVVVRVTRQADGVVLTVADTGVGIAAGDLVRVFDRFYKVDAARSHGPDGRSGGLGLAICRSLVEACGGAISIDSRPGQGTTVTVRLPAVRSAMPHPA